MPSAASAGTLGLRLEVREFEYVEATARMALARLTAVAVGEDPAAAPALLAIAGSTHRLDALPDPDGWSLEPAQERRPWRLAWAVPLALLDEPAEFVLEVDGLGPVVLPRPIRRHLAQPEEIVRWAPGGRFGVVAALLASGAIALGTQAGDARAQTGEVVIQGPDGPLVVTVDCQPTGLLPDGRACVLPACPEDLSQSDGTPCLESGGSRSESAPEAAAAEPAQAAEPEPASAGEPEPTAQSEPAQEAEPEPAAKAEPEPAAKSKPKRRPAAKAEPERRKRTAKRRPATRPQAAPAPVAKAFARAKRRAQAERRAALQQERAAQRRELQRKERRAEELRSLARQIDRAQDQPLTGGIVVPGLAMADAPEPPGFLMPIYREAGRRYGVPWQILASINEIETQYGRLLGPSPAGAVGWMQFMPATWKAYGVDADGDGRRDPDNPRDAIFAAARYLEASGARTDLPRAIFAYNHAGWYVEAVLLRAREMRWRDPKVAKLLRLRRWQLERRVLADERIEIYGCGREDIRAHRIDRRVLLVLRFLARSGLHPTVSSLDCGHSVLTKSGRISHHAFGAAVDISAINGVPIAGNQGLGSVTEAAIRRLLTLRGIMAPDQIISLIEVEGSPSTIAMGDHADHIHVGFRPRPDVRAKRERIVRRRLADERFAALARHPQGMFRLPV